jgi:NAD(P)-dependent dehydrogenase (short-subunit alcohol dehydrogenase family)
MTDSKVALVTGASRGIGRAIAIDLARHGYDIVPVGRSLEKSVESYGGTLRETSDRVEEAGRSAFPVAMDMTDFDSIRAGVEQALEAAGRVDVLVTSATNLDFTPGGTYLSQFVDTRWDALERHLRVNCMSTPLLMQLLLPGMFERNHGIIMNVTQNTSWLGMEGLPMPGEGMCGAAIPISRGVTDRLAPSLAREFAPHGVTILTFDPGMTLSNDEVRFPTTMQAGYAPEYAHSVVVPARAASHIATCNNPAVYNGKFVIALDLVREYGLMTEAEIMPDWHEGVQEVTTLPPLASAAVAPATAQR